MTSITAAELLQRGITKEALNTNLTKEGFVELADMIKAHKFVREVGGRNFRSGVFLHPKKGSRVDGALIANLFAKEMMIHGGQNAGVLDLLEVWEAMDNDGMGLWNHTMITDLQDSKDSPYVGEQGLVRLRKFERLWLRQMRGGEAVSFYSPYELYKNDWYSTTFLDAIKKNNIIVGL